MLDADIPMTFIRWLRSFLTNCRASVKLYNVCSSSRRFSKGIPQGSVVAPLLFLFYIKNLAENFSNDAAIGLFADDVSIQTTVLKKRRFSCSSLVRS